MAYPYSGYPNMGYPQQNIPLNDTNKPRDLLDVKEASPSVPRMGAAPEKSPLDKMLYTGLLVSQLLTLVAYAVVTAGAGLLQMRANELPLWEGLGKTQLAATIKVYEDVFQSTGYIQPYPQRPGYQFQYQWWIIQFELFIFCMTLICTLKPTLIKRLRPVALTFLAAALVLVMDNINAVFYLLRNATAKAVYEEYRIQAAQVGLMLVGVANFLTIICLGAYQHPEPVVYY